VSPEERVAWPLGSEFSRTGHEIKIVVGRMWLRWVQGQKIEAERIDDEEGGSVGLR
jgi:hypothetical protein